MKWTRARDNVQRTNIRLTFRLSADDMVAALIKYGSVYLSDAEMDEKLPAAGVEKLLREQLQLSPDPVSWRLKYTSDGEAARLRAWATVCVRKLGGEPSP